MKKIVVFGDLPIATKVCEYILTRNDVDLVAVVIGNKIPNNHDPFDDTPLLMDFAENNNIPQIDFDNFDSYSNNKKLTLGITCRFSKILRKCHIESFSEGVINFHGGLLPECGGLYSSIHSILEGDLIGGGTIHWLNAKIDEGDIIKRCEFDIESTDTAFSVFQKTQQSLLAGFIGIFDLLLSGQVDSINQYDLVKAGKLKRYFDRNSLDNKRQIDMQKLAYGQDSEMRRIRAFDFPGYEPAYGIMNNNKIYMRFNNF